MTMTRPILFSQQFQAYHDLTPEQYLSGMSMSRLGNEKIIHNTPEERDEFDKEMYPKYYKGPYRERLEETLSTPTNIPEFIRNLRSHPGNAAVGDPLVVARDLRGFTEEMDRNAKVNPRMLYRGARKAPSEDVKDYRPLSFSESRAAANVFAKESRGEVFKAQAGSVRGLRMKDYGVEPMTVGPRRVSEAEWLVDPKSFEG